MIFFNEQLFDGSLPQVLVTLQHKANSDGHFAADRFKGRSEQTKVHELNLNPDSFVGHSDEEICSTLVHEQVHVWQEANGTAPRKCYHDKGFAAKMKNIGLQPSDTGKPGGKETGAKMSDYIIQGGPFSQAYAKLKKSGFSLQWESLSNETKKRPSKVKYTCPECGINCWGKPELRVACFQCSEEAGELVEMFGEINDD